MPTNSLDRLLERLDRLKTRFDAGDEGQIRWLVATLARRRFAGGAEIVSFHEILLFLRAYPRSAAMAREVDGVLRRFAEIVARGPDDDADAFEDAEVSGISGTSFSAVFSYETARSLARRHPGVEVDWDYYDDTEYLGRVLPRFSPLVEEDSLVEANVPYRDWFVAAVPGRQRHIAWFLDRLDRLPDAARIYESLELLLRWDLESSAATRTRMRRPSGRLFCHDGPLLRRRDIQLAAELEAPRLPVTRLSRSEGREILDLAIDTSAVRYRELHGFTFGDPARVWHARAGRGLDIYVMGALPAHRLPLRAYHGAVFLKNGVPVGYFEGLSLFERMEVGFNLYYTFREGESAWLFARLLRLLRQMLGVTCFSIDPYQIGHENKEAIDSGAFWFYRKLGFRPVRAEQATLVEKEEQKLDRRPGYRTGARTLRRLAESPMAYEIAGTGHGDWDRFQVRNVGLAVQRRIASRYRGDPDRAAEAARSRVARALGIDPLSCGHLAQVLNLVPDLARWTRDEKEGIVAIIRAKIGGDEGRYLRLMQKHDRLRRAFLKIGSRAG